jgi:hypothetical protein
MPVSATAVAYTNVSTAVAYTTAVAFINVRYEHAGGAGSIHSPHAGTLVRTTVMRD